MRSESCKTILLSLVVTLFVVGCENNGFHATKGTPAKLGVNGEAGRAVVAESLTPSMLTQAPIVRDMQKAIYNMGILAEFDSLGKHNAKQILGAEIQASEEELSTTKTVKFKAMIELPEYVGIVGASVSVDPQANGLIRIAQSFNSGESESAENTPAALAEYSFQVISYCINNCTDLLIHFQINKGGQFYSAALYNFKLNEQNQYTCVNSSVDEDYRNLARAKENLLLRKPVGDGLDIVMKQNEIIQQQLDLKIDQAMSKNLEEIIAAQIPVSEIKIPELSLDLPAQLAPPSSVDEVDENGVSVVRVTAKRLTPEEQAIALAKEAEEDAQAAQAADKLAEAVH